MRFRLPLFALLFIAGSLALPHLAYAGIPFFGPIIPDSNVCPAGWGMLMTVINNIIELLITLAIVFVAPIMIAYAGFLYVVNAYDPSGMAKAKGILQNTIVGIVVALAGWMIVDAVMAVLYNPDTNAGKTWSSLITSSGDFCLKQAGALPTDILNPSVTLTGVNANGSATTPYGKSSAQCSSANTICSPATLINAGFTQAQANVMSCIAVTESSGNPTVCNGNACGLFQIMLTVNQLVGSACSKYNNGNPTLNCPALCKGAKGAAVNNEASCQPCVAAAKDATCNAQAAQNLISKSGSNPYAPWTTSSDNTKAAACIQNYGG